MINNDDRQHTTIKQNTVEVGGRRRRWRRRWPQRKMSEWGEGTHDNRGAKEEARRWRISWWRWWWLWLATMTGNNSGGHNNQPHWWWRGVRRAVLLCHGWRWREEAMPPSLGFIFYSSVELTHNLKSSPFNSYIASVCVCS
jgi:hypothetical protein